MATEVTMPQMGADMREGTLLRWLKHPGDSVARGEVIAEIETDKANVEIESFEDGVLAQTLVAEGQVVPVGDVIALIGDSASAGAPSPGQAQPASAGAVVPATLAASDQAASPSAQSPAAGPESPATVAAEHSEQMASPGPDMPAVEAKPADDVGWETKTEAPQMVGATSEHAREITAERPSQAAGRGELRTPPAGSNIHAPGQRLRVSPVARNVAEQLGVYLSRVKGSGPDGRVMRKDVEAAHAGSAAPAAAAASEAPTPQQSTPPSAPPAAAAINPPIEPPVAAAGTEHMKTPAPAQPPPETGRTAPSPAGALSAPAARPASAGPALVAQSRMRQAIARRMAQSKREAPHYYVTAEVDMTDAMAFRASLNEDAAGAVKVSVNDLIVKACAPVLQRRPRFNAAYTDGGPRLNPHINICVAIALPDGLIAPALLDVDGKSLGTLAREAHDLAERARGGMLRPAELNDGTFSVSNLGMYGVETLIPIIQPPQCAILGVGAVQEKPAVRSGAIVVRSLMVVALAADHRVTDGAEGGEFVRDLKDRLEHPYRFAL